MNEKISVVDEPVTEHLEYHSGTRSPTSADSLEDEKPEISWQTIFAIFVRSLSLFWRQCQP